MWSLTEPWTETSDPHMAELLPSLFASTLVARGVDVRTVAEFLGHSDGGALVLRTYSHLLPDAEDRARRAIEDALSQTARPHGPEEARHGPGAG